MRWLWSFLSGGQPWLAQVGYPRLIWILELRPSLLRKLVMRVSTVRPDKNSLAAIYLLWRSPTMSRAMSNASAPSGAASAGISSPTPVAKAGWAASRDPSTNDKPPVRCFAPGSAADQGRCVAGSPLTAPPWLTSR